MKSFYEYLAESVKVYSYRIKAIVEMDEEFLKGLEAVLRKYDVVSISKVKKTISQKNPMDFNHVKNAEVWMLDVKTHIPVSSTILQNEIHGGLKLPGSSLVVRGEHEAIELLNTAGLVADAMAKEANGRDLKPAALLNDAEYSEAVPPEVGYGDEYNKKFLAYLAQIAADREVTEVAPANAKPAKFAWLAPDADADFNKDHDTVKPVHRGTRKPGKATEAPAKVDSNGAYDDTEKTFVKNFTDKDGKKVKVERTTKEIRKD
jgi:hypothetical protein